MSALNPFRVPSGPLGRLAGWVMSRDDSPHRELVDLVRPAPGAVACEIGFGPGQLLRLLAMRDPSARLCAIDPSPVILEQARRRLAPPGARGRTDLAPGTAGARPAPDGGRSPGVPVTTCALLPDPAAG